MSQYDKLRKWLDKLVDPEFRDLIRSLLTREEQTRLPESVQSVNRGDFLGFMQTKERFDELEKYLGERYPEPTEEKPVKPVTVKPQPPEPPRLPFVNRQEELNRILSPLAPPYHLIDAPAGYGKTALLKELEDQFEKLNWLCAYVSVQKDRTLPRITHTLAAELQVSFTQDDDTRSLGQNLAEALVQQRGHHFCSQDKGKKGVILFIDIDKRPWDAMESAINFLFTNFIPDIEQVLHGFEFFQKGYNLFRVVFAGRYLAGKTPRRTPFQLSPVKLTPFNYEVVRETVKAYLPQQREVGQLTAHLMHITAGHPGIIARVLSLYQQRGQHSPDEFFRHYADEIWEGIVWPESDAIRKDIDRELRRFFDYLTFFRYLNESVLQDLLDQMRRPKYPDAVDLADVLTGAYLMNWEGRLLRDSLTRGLLVRRFLREIETDAFAERCLRAQEICAVYLKEPAAQMPEKWMIELLFQHLQEHTSDIQSPQKRAEIRQNFFANVVPDALQLLVNNRKPRPQQAHLGRALKEDWEFRFTVNYYLREDLYNDEPYDELLKQIEHFFCARRSLDHLSSTSVIQ
ncbi:MAG: hypothetical protein ACPGWR_04640 [Ardenticatenaceae bacterium]